MNNLLFICLETARAGPLRRRRRTIRSVAMSLLRKSPDGTCASLRLDDEQAAVLPFIPIYAADNVIEHFPDRHDGRIEGYLQRRRHRPWRSRGS